MNLSSRLPLFLTKPHTRFGFQIGVGSAKADDLKFLRIEETLKMACASKVVGTLQL